jgi:hypothetical protein
MSNEVMVPASLLLRQVERLLKFPHPTICRHFVAGNLLDALERSGFPLTQALAGAVVRAEDDRALRLLKKFLPSDG